MVFNRISTLYTQIKDVDYQAAIPLSNEIDERISALAGCLQENREALVLDLKQNKEHARLYKDIKKLNIPLERLTPILDSLDVIELRAIISEINTVLQAENINITSAMMSRRESPPRLRRINPFRLSLGRTGGMVRSSWIENINIIRRGLEHRNLLTPEFGEALSKLIALELGLHKVKTANEAHTKINRYIVSERGREAAFVDWINACHIPLRDAGLTSEQLKIAARDLQFVDCTNIELENLERFISSCTRSHHLIISSSNVKKLDTLPVSLRTILISDCPLNELDVSKNALLESIGISNCPIEAVDVSENAQVKWLCIESCPNLKTLLLPDALPQCEVLKVEGCPKLEVKERPSQLPVNANVSGFLPVEELSILSDESHPDDEAQTAPHDDSWQRHIFSMLNSCARESRRYFNMFMQRDYASRETDDIRNINDASSESTDESSQSDSDFIHSEFLVNPHELENEPLQLLFKLGNHLVGGGAMPEVIWWDHETDERALGEDYGGVGRQLVTTLCDNLFKKGSGFAFTKQLRPGEEELTGKLPLLVPPTNAQDVLALTIFARLIALCSNTELGTTYLMGAHLAGDFYNALASLADEEIDSIESDLVPLDNALRKKIWLSLQYLEPEDADEKDLEGISDSMVLPVAIVAKELKCIPEFSWEELRSNIPAFIDRVQGKEVTKQLLQANMLFEGDKKRHERDEMGIIEGFFDKFMNEHPTKLKDLVELFTSCRTIRDPITIEVYPSREVGNLPIIHTCAQIVEVPLYEKYEQFEKKLLESFTTLKTFNIR